MVPPDLFWKEGVAVSKRSFTSEYIAVAGLMPEQFDSEKLVVHFERAAPKTDLERCIQ